MIDKLRNILTCHTLNVYDSDTYLIKFVSFVSAALLITLLYY